MRAKFIGDPNDNFSGPGQITVWGVEFKFDQWTEVTDPRFARHNHFETDDGPKRRKGSKADVEPETVVEEEA